MADRESSYHAELVGWITIQDGDNHIIERFAVKESDTQREISDQVYQAITQIFNNRLFQQPPKRRRSR